MFYALCNELDLASQMRVQLLLLLMSTSIQWSLAEVPNLLEEEEEVEVKIVYSSFFS